MTDDYTNGGNDYNDTPDPEDPDASATVVILSAVAAILFVCFLLLMYFLAKKYGWWGFIPKTKSGSHMILKKSPWGSTKSPAETISNSSKISDEHESPPKSKKTKPERPKADEKNDPQTQAAALRGPPPTYNQVRNKEAGDKPTAPNKGIETQSLQRDEQITDNKTTHVPRKKRIRGKEEVKDDKGREVQNTPPPLPQGRRPSRDIKNASPADQTVNTQRGSKDHSPKLVADSGMNSKVPGKEITPAQAATMPPPPPYVKPPSREASNVVSPTHVKPVTSKELANMPPPPPYVKPVSKIETNALPSDNRRGPVEREKTLRQSPDVTKSMSRGTTNALPTDNKRATVEREKYTRQAPDITKSRMRALKQMEHEQAQPKPRRSQMGGPKEAEAVIITTERRTNSQGQVVETTSTRREPSTAQIPKVAERSLAEFTHPDIWRSRQSLGAMAGIDASIHGLKKLAGASRRKPSRVIRITKIHHMKSSTNPASKHSRIQSPSRAWQTRPMMVSAGTQSGHFITDFKRSLGAGAKSAGKVHSESTYFDDTYMGASTYGDQNTYGGPSDAETSQGKTVKRHARGSTSRDTKSRNTREEENERKDRRHSKDRNVGKHALCKDNWEESETGSQNEAELMATRPLYTSLPTVNSTEYMDNENNTENTGIGICENKDNKEDCEKDTDVTAPTIGINISNLNCIHKHNYSAPGTCLHRHNHKNHNMESKLESLDKFEQETENLNSENNKTHEAILHGDFNDYSNVGLGVITNKSLRDKSENVDIVNEDVAKQHDDSDDEKCNSRSITNNNTETQRVSGLSHFRAMIHKRYIHKRHIEEDV